MELWSLGNSKSALPLLLRLKVLSGGRLTAGLTDTTALQGLVPQLHRQRSSSIAPGRTAAAAAAAAVAAPVIAAAVAAVAAVDVAAVAAVRAKKCGGVDGALPPLLKKCTH